MSGQAPRSRYGKKAADPWAEKRRNGLSLVARHPLFAPLAGWGRWHEAAERNRCPPAGWAVVASTGRVHLHPARRGEPEEWAWVAAHCLLHLGFDHLAERHLAGNRFLAHLKVGRPPAGLGGPGQLDHLGGTAGEDALAARLRSLGTPLDLAGAGPGGHGGDLLWDGVPTRANAQASTSSSF